MSQITLFKYLPVSKFFVYLSIFFQRPFLRGLFSEGLIFGGAYIRREICVLKSSTLILGGKFGSQNRLGSLIVGRKFLSVICRKIFLKLALWM